MRVLRVLIPALAVFVVGTAAFAAVDADQAKRIDHVFDKWNHSDSPGCALALMQNGEIMYSHGYGMADLEHGAAITPATPFHVASVSKQFTAAAIVLLAEDGKLSFDDDVRKYIPEVPDFGVRITIRNLLHHTSGFRDQWELLEFAGWRYSLDLITNQDVLYVVTRQRELNFPPGDRFLYSNTGYTLLGEIVRRVSGKSLREFTTERIFQPLGMSHTHFRDDHAELIKGQAYGYVPSKDNKWRLSITNFDTVGATSLFTTAEDLSHWDQNFYHSKLGGAHFLDDMLHRDKLNGGELQNYAFGITLGNYRGLPTVGHDGADAGYRATFIRFPNQKFTIACLCNAGPDASPRALANQVADLFLASQYEAATEPPQFPQPAPTELQKFVGVYWNRSNDEITRIAVKRDALAVLAGDDVLPLHATKPDTFQLEKQRVEFQFFQAADGKPAGLRVVSEYARPETSEKLPPVKLESAAMHEYTGDYASGEIELVYHIAFEDGKPVLKRLKHDPSVLDAVGTDLFTTDFGTVRFVRDTEHNVSGMLISTGRIYNLRFHKATSITEGSPSTPSRR